MNDRPSQSESGPPGSAGQLDLEHYRTRINDVDARLIEMLNERAQLVVEIGRVKRGDGSPIYAPHREREVLGRVLAQNPGPLSERTIEAIYREIMSGSFSLELPLRVGYLGPPGSFSHVAASRHFGASIEYDDLHTIDGVFEEVSAGRVNYGLVPYENSIMGGITDTLDAFQEHEVTIYAEALIEVAHYLLANSPPNEITRIYSKSQIFDQCRKWLATQFPKIELIPTASSASAVMKAAQEPHAAAIGSQLAGHIYGVNTVFENIQDKPNNITRFLIIGRQHAEPTGEDKTTIMFTTRDRPGALVDVLGVFRDAGINLSHIDKRPSGRTNWDYTFFIDGEAHASEEGMQRAVEEAKSHCIDLTVLGSYPRATRVL